MLTHAVGMCWHALVRDVLALGYRTADMFTTLSVADMVAIVVGAPPTSSVRYFLDEGWSREAHLLANMQEGTAGIARLEEPYRRPGTQERADERLFRGDAMSWDEMDRLDAERYGTAAAERPVGTARVRTI